MFQPFLRFWQADKAVWHTGVARMEVSTLLEILVGSPGRTPHPRSSTGVSTLLEILGRCSGGSPTRRVEVHGFNPS